ncbi:fibrobacter succinogenes major paralogous domain-containing protein [Flavobacteriales bacterium]|nr:fibrobacter succinogenes major paralogous domain-containing protein [Flavobacteriales bacterium]
MEKVILTMVVALLATSGMAQSDCGELLDHNQDGVIGVEDLMNLLCFFGQPLEVDAGPCDNLESVTFDGYDYDLVAIGDQCWFAQNLRTEHYANGDAVLSGMTGAEWGDVMFPEGSWYAGKMTVYGEHEGAWCVAFCDPSTSLPLFGRLYNFSVVIDDRGICPAGWHIPTSTEWMDLFSYVDSTTSSGTVVSALSAEVLWSGGGTSFVGSDDFGFGAKPVGFRDDSYGSGTQDGYIGAGALGTWWCWADLEVWAYSAPYVLFGNNQSHGIATQQSPYGRSIRCLKDS